MNIKRKGRRQRNIFKQDKETPIKQLGIMKYVCTSVGKGVAVERVLGYRVRRDHETNGDLPSKDFNCVISKL